MTDDMMNLRTLVEKTGACRKPIGWRLTENRAMLLFNEGSCQAHLCSASSIFVMCCCRT